MIEKHCPTCGHKVKLTPEEIKQNHREGIEAAKARGVFYGRHKKYNHKAIADAHMINKSKSTRKTAKLFGCSRSVVEDAMKKYYPHYFRRRNLGKENECIKPDPEALKASFLETKSFTGTAKLFSCSPWLVKKAVGNIWIIEK